jgi:hypothetical protein
LNYPSWENVGNRLLFHDACAFDLGFLESKKASAWLAFLIEFELMSKRAVQCFQVIEVFLGLALGFGIHRIGEIFFRILDLLGKR